MLPISFQKSATAKQPALPFLKALRVYFARDFGGYVDNLLAPEKRATSPSSSDVINSLGLGDDNDYNEFQSDSNTTIELQKIEKEWEAAEALYEKEFQKTKNMELQLLQAYLEIVKAKAKGSSETLIKAQANAVIKRDNKLIQSDKLKFASDAQDNVRRKSQEIVEAFRSKHLEKLEVLINLANVINKEKESIEAKLQKATNAKNESQNKDTKESSTESDIKNQEEEALQARLDAIEQKIQVLAMEALIVKMSANQEMQTRGEVVDNSVQKTIEEYQGQIEMFRSKEQEAGEIKQEYKEEIKLANEEITKLDKQLLEKNARRKQVKREELKKLEKGIVSIKKDLTRAHTHLNNVKGGEESANKEMNRLFRKEEYWTKKMNNFVRDLAATNTENESEELKKEALKLEESFKDLKGGTASQNTQTTLAKVTQKVTIIQGAIAGMDSLKQSIFEAKESREKTLKFIAKYDKKIKSPEEGDNPEEVKKIWKMAITRQLNTDQEQRERIQEFRDIKRYLESEQPPQEYDSETLNIDFNEILKDSANFTKTYITGEKIIPDLRMKNTEALGRLIEKDFEENNTIDKLNELFDQARLNVETRLWFKEMLLDTHSPIYQRLEIFSVLTEAITKENQNRQHRADKRGVVRLTLDEIHKKNLIQEEQEEARQNAKDAKEQRKNEKEQKREAKIERAAKEEKRKREALIQEQNAAIFARQAEEDANDKIRLEKQEAYKKERKEKIISQQEKAKTFSEAEKLRQEQPVDPSEYNLTFGLRITVVTTVLSPTFLLTL
jgi:hypothetical protein